MKASTELSCIMHDSASELMYEYDLLPRMTQTNNLPVLLSFAQKKSGIYRSSNLKGEICLEYHIVIYTVAYIHSLANY